MRIVLISLLFCNFIFADDYSFDMDEIEVKTYEYKGYLKAEQKHQKTQNNDTLNSTYGEAQVDFKYFKNDYTLNSQFQANHSNINNSEKNIYTTNQLYLNYKYSSNHSVNIGKESLKWGKGYFFNPVAFVDRPKDVNDPEASKEGYNILNYKYNKSYNGDLKNFNFNMVYVEDTSSLALKTYFLYLDTDIDIVYFTDDELSDKIGIDFSKNIETNFEIHGEFAKEQDGNNSYLVGLKYLTENDLTITSEYFKRFDKKEYFINKFSLKEPFGIVYSTVYYKKNFNVDDKLHQDTLGGIYSFRNNITVDISYNKNVSNDILWSKVIWYF